MPTEQARQAGDGRPPDGELSARAPGRAWLRKLWSPYLWYFALAFLIAAPLMRGGYLLLLDFALIKNVPVQWWPTEVNPGPVNIAPAQAALWVLAKLGYAAGPILIFSLFFAMGALMHRVASALMEVSTPAALLAGTLYMVNPFTYDRLMAGHILFLWAYALGPVVVGAAIRCARDPSRPSAVRWGLATAGLAWTGLHYLVMHFVLVVPLVLLHRTFRSRKGTSASLWAAGVFLVLNAWWIAGLFIEDPGARITERDVDVFKTQPTGPAALGNVAALYGFWRNEFTLPKDGVQGWWLLALPLAALVVVGAGRVLRDPARRSLAVALLTVTPVAILLATGTSWQMTRGAFLSLYQHLPGFALFREPQKWVAMLPLSYGMLGAVGVHSVTGRLRAGSGRRAVTILTLVAVMVYGHTLLWNWERLTPVRFPSDWEKVDQIVRAEGGGALLFLPWHMYLTFDFTGRRVLNPAGAYFSMRTLSGNEGDFDVPGPHGGDPSIRRIGQALASRTGRMRFSEVLHGQCVNWVALAQAGDVGDYAWLKASGLASAFRGKSLHLFRVPGPPTCSR